MGTPSQSGAPVAVPGLAEAQADPGVLERLPIDVLLDLQRQIRHLDADIDRAVSRQTVQANRHHEIEGDQLLSIPKVAAILDFKPQYVYELIRRDLLSAVTVGKYVRVRRSTVERFMKDGPIAQVDGKLYQRYTGSSGRPGTPSAQKARRIDPSISRRPSRRGAEHDRPVGAERARDLQADGAVDQDTGEPEAKT
jgi:excisionase family DNA binding protein